MRYSVGVVHVVEDAERAAAFLREWLGFEPKEGERTDDVVVANGAIEIRLVESGRPFRSSPLRLELRCRDLEAQAHLLATEAGFEALEGERAVGPLRREQALRGPHGFEVLLTRTFTEDEIGLVPPLPITLDWAPDVLEDVRLILRLVPDAFRAGARTRVTQQAEAHALAEGELRVEERHAMRALVASTPSFQHEALRSAMEARGRDGRRWVEGGTA